MLLFYSHVVKSTARTVFTYSVYKLVILQEALYFVCMCNTGQARCWQWYIRCQHCTEEKVQVQLQLTYFELVEKNTQLTSIDYSVVW